MLQQLFTNFALYGGTRRHAMRETTEVDAGTAVVVLIFMLIFMLIAYVIGSLILMAVFKKAGVSPGKAWIPIYNGWIFMQIGGQQGFWCLIPIANMVFWYIAAYNINLKLGKGGGEFALAIFLPGIWLIIIACDSSQWNEMLGSPRQDTPDQSYGGYQNYGYATPQYPQQPSYNTVTPNQQPQYNQQPQPPQNYGPQPPQYNQPQPPQNYGPQPPQNYGPQGYYGDPNQQPAPQDYNQQSSQGGYNLNGPVQEPAKKPRSTSKKKI